MKFPLVRAIVWPDEVQTEMLSRSARLVESYLSIYLSIYLSLSIYNMMSKQQRSIFINFIYIFIHYNSESNQIESNRIKSNQIESPAGLNIVGTMRRMLTLLPLLLLLLFLLLLHQ